MSEFNLYQELAERTGGSFLIGVVGPVRTGKSTFIKRFMETLVIPNIEDPYSRERAKDELPQSASGKTIMTAEPKFVPEEAVEIRLSDDTHFSLRMIDCVGYMVDGASGLFEDGQERMVTTPWFDREVTITEAAEAGTQKVIRDHSSIGLVVTTDGSFGELARESFLEAEGRVIGELKAQGKPFAVILNSASPEGAAAKKAAEDILTQYGVACLRINCQTMDAEDISALIRSVLDEFPVSSLGIFLPEWVEALPDGNEMKSRVFQSLREKLCGVTKMKDLSALLPMIEEEAIFSAAHCVKSDLGKGAAVLHVEMPRTLYYETISSETGLQIDNDADLIAMLSEMAGIKTAYDRICAALKDVSEKGYGVVYPDLSQMNLAEPQIVRQNGRYSVRLRADAPAIHMMKTQIETEVSPAIGGENASGEIINFLLQGFDGDFSRIWESNIFGKSLNELAEEGLRRKIDNLPKSARVKLKDTLQRMINEGSSTLFCLLL